MDIEILPPSKQEGLFDILSPPDETQEQNNLWAILQKFLCNSSNANKKTLIDLYARDFSKKHLYETISKKFA